MAAAVAPSDPASEGFRFDGIVTASHMRQNRRAERLLHHVIAAIDAIGRAGRSRHRIF
jgi:hypothetical protein